MDASYVPRLKGPGGPSASQRDIGHAYGQQHRYASSSGQALPTANHHFATEGNDEVGDTVERTTF